MPLPDSNVQWPPADQTEALKLYDRWGAWYAGDPDKLAEVYQAPMAGIGAGFNVAEQPSSGLLGQMSRGLARMFWGSPVPSGQLRQHKMHIPLASDISSTSADLLFGEPPEITFPDVKPTSPLGERIEKILDEANAFAAWHEGAETCSAYSGTYLRVRWDPEVAEVPLFEALPPDCAVPEWRTGRLVAVTLYRRLPRPDARWWWHLERHEPGRVFHGLYASQDENKLGRPLPLQDHPDTEMFAELVDADGGYATGAKGLACEYVPNMRPNRVLRGSMLGRSDYAGLEPLLDALDEAWSSWMRDLRLGKGRLIVPRSYMQSAGRGKGASFDADREIFESVDALTSPDGGLAIQNVQFAIRVQEHMQTCAEITTHALRGAGYSAQTFGEQGDVAMTATETVARESASYRTRAKKIGYWRGPLARIIRTALEIDVAQFHPDGVTLSGDLPALDWPDGVAVDPMQQAQTLQALAAAEAASIQRRVELLNPDWEDADVQAEVKRIKADAAGPPIAPPGAGTTGFGPDGAPPDAGADGGNPTGAVGKGDTAPADKTGAGDTAARQAGRPAPTRPRPRTTNGARRP
jgi:Phage portal protein, SPP1 Gp6-like